MSEDVKGRCRCAMSVLKVKSTIDGLISSVSAGRESPLVRDELDVLLGDLEEHCGLARADVRDIGFMVDNGEYLRATAMLRGTVARCIGDRGY